ncbi:MULTISPECIES: hypothetical protein [Flavobacterium]|uniref:DUF4369 domain-containing protein n=1 Tax=Flavobacterium jumunjinense TaxID=998845 RepID=A0ABV5GJI6_9FLAO|nr:MULTISPECIES: hypothetical protein [Flavobacterium]
MKRNYSLLLLLFIIGFNVQAQKIDLKRGSVIANDQKVFDYDKRNLGSEISIFKLGSKTELIYIEVSNNNTLSYLNDDYVRIVFPQNETTVLSTTLIDKNFEKIIQLLFLDNVVDFEGNINPENLKLFTRKYNNKK